MRAMETGVVAASARPASERFERFTARFDAPTWRLVIADAIAVAVAWLSPMVFGLGARHGLEAAMIAVVVAVPVGVLMQVVNHLYAERIASLRTVEILRLFRTPPMLAVAMLVLFRLAHVYDGLRWIILASLLMLPCLLISRSAFRSWLNAAHDRDRFIQTIVVFGINDETVELINIIDDHRDSGFRVAGVVGRHEDAVEHTLEHRFLGDYDAMHDILAATGASRVLLVASAVPNKWLNTVVSSLHHAGVSVQLSTGVMGVGHKRMAMVPIAYQPLFAVEPFRASPAMQIVKRGVDIFVALVALIATAPMLGLAALAVKREDGGPVFFKQRRVGLNGQPFDVLKLRTMVVDAESKLDDLKARNQRNGPLFKLAGDPRQTRVGGFLRSSSIDELPQLINVLRGDMSLVGPRPALPAEVADFDVQLLDRTRVRPGITGLWQVESRDNPAFGPYRRLDLYYVNNWSIWLDVVILIATFEQVIARAMRLARTARPAIAAEPALAVVGDADVHELVS